jgi:F-type H+-transporting ATPase subunit a
MKAVFNYSVIKPFAYFGWTSTYWDVHIDILAQTWVMMAILVGIIFLVRMLLLSKENIYFKQGVLLATGFFVDTIEETCGSFKQDIFYFVTTIFLFIAGSGLVGLVPYMGEPTQDLNTTFALGISSFLFVQYQGIKAHGVYHFNDYLQPFAFFLPLNIVGELAKAASMSFRLFGNILGGSIMVDLLLHALEQVRDEYLILVGIIFVLSIFFYFFPSMRRFVSYKSYSLDRILLTIVVVVPSIKIFFGAIEGLIQAFVLTTLTITYSSMAIGVEEAHGVQTDTITKEA